MESIGDRVRARRKELRLSQTALAKRVGTITYQAVQQVEKGGETKHLLAFSRALEVRPEWLEKGELPKETNVNPANHPGLKVPNRVPPSPQQGTDDRIKVLGMAECGPDGWALWNGDVVDHVPRPPFLAGATQAYAVYAAGDSMEPRYHAGELIYVHPGKPVTLGAYVLVQIHPKEDGEAPRAFIKRLVKRSGDKVTFEQYNPAKNFTLKSAEILSIHRVVGSGEA